MSLMTEQLRMTIVHAKYRTIGATIAARAFADLLTRKRFPELTTAVICMASFFVAFDLLMRPGDYTDKPAFAIALDAAAPQFWGGLLIIPTVLTSACLAVQRRDVWVPVLFMCAWFCVWSFTLALAASQSGTTNSLAWAFSAMSVLLAIVTTIKRRESRHGAAE